MDNNKIVNQLCKAHYVISTAEHRMASIAYLSPEISVILATTQDFFFLNVALGSGLLVCYREGQQSPFHYHGHCLLKLAATGVSLSIKLHRGTIDPPLAIADWPRGGD